MRAAVSCPQPEVMKSTAPSKVDLAVRDLFGERQRIPGLDQHMEAPALDLRFFVLVGLDDLGASRSLRVGSLSFKTIPLARSWTS